MSLGSLFREIWEFVPILLLLLAGSVIAVKSGVHRPASSRDLWQLAGNFYQMLLRVIGYAAVLLALQYWIGLRPVLGW